MNLVFDSPDMYVIDYPSQDALEILDKRNGRIGVVRGEAARRFRAEFDHLAAGDAELEDFEDFIEGFEPSVTYPATRH